MNVLSLFQFIKIFIFDIDGVLTNGRLLVAEDGQLLRSMNVKDGFALQLAIKKGYEIVVISGGQSEASRNRLQKLGIDKVFIGVPDKLKLLKKIIAENNWQPENMLYMGDDLPDISSMTLCGLATCPADAVNEIKQLSAYVSPFLGGEGCVRDVIEKSLKIQDNWS